MKNNVQILKKLWCYMVEEDKSKEFADDNAENKDGSTTLEDDSFTPFIS